MKLTKNNILMVIADSLKIGVEEVKIETSLTDDICIDSIEIVKLSADIETNFGIEIKVDDLKECDTAKAIFAFLIKEELKNIIASSFLVDKDKLSCENQLSDQGFIDSKNIFQLLIDIEKHFDIIIGEYIEFDDFSTINNITSYIINRNE